MDYQLTNVENYYYIYENSFSEEQPIEEILGVSPLQNVSSQISENESSQKIHRNSNLSQAEQTDRNSDKDEFKEELDEDEESDEEGEEDEDDEEDGSISDDFNQSNDNLDYYEAEVFENDEDEYLALENGILGDALDFHLSFINIFANSRLLLNDRIISIIQNLEFRNQLYPTKFKAKEVKLKASSDIKRTAGFIIKHLKGNKFDEVVVMASGKALELLIPVTSTVSDRFQNLFHYNWHPTQYIIENDPFIITISMRVRLSLKSPSNMKIYNDQPNLKDIIKHWRYMLKNIKKAKSQYYRSLSKDPWNLPKFGNKQNSKNQSSNNEDLKSHHDTCAIWIEQFTEDMKAKIQSLISASKSNPQTTGVSMIDEEVKLTNENELKLYRKISKFKNNYLKRWDSYYPKEETSGLAKTIQGDGVWLINECTHCFHKACLREWVKTKSTCPSWRAQIQEEKQDNTEFRFLSTENMNLGVND